MPTNVIPIDNFQREAKKLAKKYRSLKSDIEELIESLIETPRQGVLITENTYKVRMAISSKGRGKSGGARVITFVVTETDDGLIEIYLLSIYDKSDQENVSDGRIKELLDIANEIISSAASPNEE